MIIECIIKPNVDYPTVLTAGKKYRASLRENGKVLVIRDDDGFNGLVDKDCVKELIYG